ncbi:hypothetical protein ACKWTF_012936 [Chironomus riparius]
MGNCLNRFAFKPDDEEEEPTYERIRSKARENIQKRSRYNVTEQKRERDSSCKFRALDDIFEPLPFDANTEENKGRSSKSVELSVAVVSVSSEGAKVAAREGIFEVISELKRELSHRKDWMNKPTVFKKVEEDKDATVNKILSEKELDQELNLDLDLHNKSNIDKKADVPEQKQEQSSSEVSKNPKRQFRKKQCKANKRQVSPEDSSESSDDEALNVVELDRKVNFNLELQPAQEPDRKIISPCIEIPTKRSTSFKLVKPHYVSKNIANMKKSNRIASIKKQNNFVPVKAKDD